jgi:membrane-associated phospholipid phosphatase
MALVAASAILTPTRAHAADPDKVEWSPDWRRMQLAEVIGSLALVVVNPLVDTRIPYPDHATWTGGILFDNWARDVFRGHTAATLSTASTLTDWFYKAGPIVPVAVDAYFAALGIHQNADVALQMALIDLESYGVSALVSLTLEHAIGRARPYTEDCNARDPSSGALLHQCGTTNDFRSFYSGHATATATTAGLVCVEHQHLPLFGGGLADLAPCLLMIGVSVTTGILRVVYDEHWASDVVTGWIVGGAAGYLLPAALHYGFAGRRLPGEIVAGDLHALPTVLAVPGGAGAALVGLF